MSNIQQYFKQIVTQKIFLASLLETTIAISIIFALMIYWINDQIDNNNATIVELMKANITLTGYDLQQIISQMGFIFNVSSIIINSSTLKQKNSTLLTQYGSFTQQEETIISMIQDLININVQGIDYNFIQLTSKSIKQYAYNNRSFILQTNCETQLCNFLSQFQINNDESDYILYMQNQKGNNEVFTTYYPNNITLTQICGQIINEMYLCFLLDLTSYKQSNGVLYGLLFTINNSVISDVTDQCLDSELQCNAQIQLQQYDMDQDESTDVLQFLDSIENTIWTNQLKSLTYVHQAQDPILRLSLTDIKVFFYQPLSVGVSSTEEEYDSEYKEDIENQDEEELQQLQELQQNFNKWQLLATFKNNLYESLIDMKESEYYIFLIFYQFFILLMLLTPILINFITNSDFIQIKKTINQVTLMMQFFFEMDYDSQHLDIIQFKKQNHPTLIELKQLMQVFEEFCWLINFLNQLNKRIQDLDKLKLGLQVFQRRNNLECLEIVLQKLVSENSRQKNYEIAIEYNKQLLNLLEKQKKENTSTKQEEIVKLNYKLFEALNQLLDLLSKMLIRNKDSDRNTWNQAKSLFSNLLDYADTLDIKFTLQIKLLFKKCKLLNNLRKVKEAEICIKQAQEILLDNFTAHKTTQNHNNQAINQDKKILTIMQQKIYYYRGIMFMASNQVELAIQYLMLALIYGNVYYTKLRVKTIKMISKLLSKQRKFEEESRILKQIQYFFRNEKREFKILIDSTMKLAENLVEVVGTVKEIFKIMNDDDQIHVSIFDEKSTVVIETQSKLSILENQGRNYMDDGFYDILSGTQTHNQRLLYQAILDISQQKTKLTQYLIILTFGENFTEQSDLFIQTLDKLREEYYHFILCSTQEKKYMNQRSTFYRMTDEARDGTYIELFVNFDEGLMKLIQLCN